MVMGRRLRWRIGVRWGTHPPLGAPQNLKTIIATPALCYSSPGFVFAGYEQSLLPNLRYQVVGSRSMFLVRLEDAAATPVLLVFVVQVALGILVASAPSPPACPPKGHLPSRPPFRPDARIGH
eukprot:5945856-Pyramimonas_sp.AAC.1